jgi:hypothetical protein
MSIEYTYEIVAVDAAAKCMEVVYQASGRQTMHIGARLPYEGETLEAVVKMYEPVAYWLEQEREVVVPPVGASGTIVPVQVPAVEEIAQPETVYDVGATTMLVSNV